MAQATREDSRVDVSRPREGCNPTQNVNVSTQALSEFSKRVHYQLTAQRATGRVSPDIRGNVTILRYKSKKRIQFRFRSVLCSLLSGISHLCSLAPASGWFDQLTVPQVVLSEI